MIDFLNTYGFQKAKTSKTGDKFKSKFVYTFFAVIGRISN